MNASQSLTFLAGALAYLTVLASCTTVPVPPPTAALESGRAAAKSRGHHEDPKPVVHHGDDSEQAVEPKDRRGLATSFGETLDSQVVYQDFKRGFLAKPFAVGVLHYNDGPGAEAMAAQIGGAVPFSGDMVTTAKGVADWGLKSPNSGYLGGYLADDKVILEGREGDRYAIMLKNNTRQPLEFVLSVDGLDVIDGHPASYKKRGYVVGPKRILEVKGFRTSTSQVAAFQFGQVSNAYAVRRHGDARNVGVIGVAVFSAGGKNPWTAPRGDPQREEADPFPAQRFAIPPS